MKPIVILEQGVRIRIARGDASTEPAFACVLLPSGHRSKFDERTAEYDIFGEVVGLLTNNGVVCFEIDFPPKFGNSDLSDIHDRLERLSVLLNSEQFAPYRERFFTLGFSMGGQVALQFLSSSPKLAPSFAIFCSTIIDQAVLLDHRPAHFSFFYGAHDRVVYCDSKGDPVQVLSAESYSSFPKQKLVSTRRQRITSHILPDVGHFLSSEGVAPKITATTLVEHIQALLIHASD